MALQARWVRCRTATGAATVTVADSYCTQVLLLLLLALLLRCSAFLVTVHPCLCCCFLHCYCAAQSSSSSSVAAPLGSSPSPASNRSNQCFTSPKPCTTTLCISLRRKCLRYFRHSCIPTAGVTTVKAVLSPIRSCASSRISIAGATWLGRRCKYVSLPASSSPQYHCSGADTSAAVFASLAFLLLPLYYHLARIPATLWVRTSHDCLACPSTYP